MKIIGLALVAYAALVAGCTMVQRSLMYFPDDALPSPSDAGAPGFQVVTLRTTDGLALVSWYQPAKKGFATIVYFQGNGGNIAQRIYKTLPLVRAGYGLLLVGYRGYGGNPGKPSEEGLYEDGRAALAYLQEQGLPHERLILLGESLGTGVAVRMAWETSVRAVILEAPYTSTVDVGQAAYFFLPVGLLMYDRFPSVDLIAEIKAPLLVVHGEADRIIPTRFGRRLYRAASQPKEAHFLAGASHNDMVEFGLLDIELRFLAGLKKPSG
ncbi:MAG: alpha/beta hydrolase [Rhodospirillaceae bacterium]|nr:alpha/beta hydrolase [Rhodospirillaceae bacterium]MBT4043747.1 alpha/beta hydrolase [Rhodospirillaceae bacterium]MBT4689276.1 alpha/beta hydrolase [Rhodospirillaceae bacterium]MBT5079349.1 alpha/beta hydrolase [Rhodospirillaceae bacterium]MBT5525825.1 alpha/beta hydrolase [Rhodospirillaceae bacterium]